ncbi:MAG: alpha/beta hydrolase [Pseudomonadota bacterium]|nr:alpha/beta hydrolase [Pseudomonadota bacterium]
MSSGKKRGAAALRRTGPPHAARPKRPAASTSGEIPNRDADVSSQGFGIAKQAQGKARDTSHPGVEMSPQDAQVAAASGDVARAAERRLQTDLELALRAQMATVTGGLAPDVYVDAWRDWFLNLAKAPPKQLQVMQDALCKSIDNFAFAMQAAGPAPLSPGSGHDCFSGDAWARWPFNVLAHSYRNYADWWHSTLSGVPGVAPKDERTLNFAARNALELASPANYLATNPELLDITRREAGANLVRGLGFWVEDVQRALRGETGRKSGKFIIGRDIAATPGKVVMRNDLVELIQYAPTTETVFAEPILIIPAWIMKYYILDLSTTKSLVNYLVSRGHTVFIVSWKNPTGSDRGLGMDDYLRLGIRATVDAVSRIVPDQKIHSVGYCIGGTLLSIAAAVFAAEDDQRLASMTLLAAQQDFSECGELSVFISPSQLDMLEAVMSRTGVLESERMSAAFALLRSHDLLWTPAINTYVRGKREEPNELMDWNADGTRMPCRMHAEYLRKLYLDNALVRGEFLSEDRRVDLGRIRLPMFIVGTETDHVAPWQSVYKARALTRSSDYTFLLTSGGHNAGIISGPVHPRRHCRVRTWFSESETLSPEVWFETTQPRTGSWWPIWQEWLAAHSPEVQVAPPVLGSAAAGFPPLADAPGSYVRQE